MTFLEKLLAIQLALKVPKDKKTEFKQTKYRYRSVEDILEAVKPMLDKHKLLLSLDTSYEGNHMIARAIIKDIETGESMERSAYVREDTKASGMSDSQKSGAALSYARKYALGGLFLIDETKDMDSQDYIEGNQYKDYCCECGQRIQPYMTQKKSFTAEEMIERSNIKYGKTICVDCVKKLIEEEEDGD